MKLHTRNSQTMHKKTLSCQIYNPLTCLLFQMLLAKDLYSVITV